MYQECTEELTEELEMTSSFSPRHFGGKTGNKVKFKRNINLKTDEIR